MASKLTYMGSKLTYMGPYNTVYLTKPNLEIAHFSLFCKFHPLIVVGF